MEDDDDKPLPPPPLDLLADFPPEEDPVDPDERLRIPTPVYPRAASQERILQGWKSMSHCQEFCQSASWLLIGCTRVNNQSEDRSAS